MPEWFEGTKRRIASQTQDLPEFVQMLVGAQLSAFEDFIAALERVEAFDPLGMNDFEMVTSAIVSAHLGRIEEAVTTSDLDELLLALGSSTDVADAVMSHGDIPLERFSMVRDAAKDLAEASAYASSRRSAVRARLAAAEAEAAASAARALSSQGAVGDLGLADYFSRYSESELRTSNQFRGVTFLLSAFAVGIAVVGAWRADGSKLSDSLVAQVLLVVSIGGFAAYTGRLAGQHRLKGDWAAAVAVQLWSLQNFVAPVDEATKAQIYLHFSARVLGPPPTIKGESETPGLVDVVATDLLRRRAAESAS